ncbi:tetratricopeptide repeat protein [Tumebacillus sp. DT12]|uniref:Tetratricopeptide repeat protein n=1 Tax=Tumebacillus lacus TaxID=2995335 RepID=A0ABT3X165_9BACL|nr:tetratricopeptide repeat protein [Tumebacillus lacus]MCX7569512.1 tetratricopeptide repeat protein [Tumebacillus lacus]
MFSLGQRLREIRLKKKMTQIDLAKGICTASMISQIESDRARPSYKMLIAIAERLDTQLETLLIDTDMNLEHVSAFKMARALVGAKEYPSAIPYLEELLKEQRSQVSTIDIQLELGECLLHTGDLDRAEKQLHEVQEWGVLRQDHHKVARTLKLLGEIEERRRRYPLAAFLWEKGLASLERMDHPDLFLRAEILHVLGTVQLKMERPHDAQRYLDEAAALYAGTDNLRAIGHVYLGLSTSYQQQNDLQMSVDYSERAAGIFKGLEDRLFVLRNQVTSAISHIASGQAEEAEPMLQDAYKQFVWMGQIEEAGTTLVEIAKLMSHLGRWEECEAACLQTQNVLPDHHICQAWVHRLRAKVDLHLRQQRQTAIHRYQTAAEVYLQQKELREYGDTMFELSCVYVEVKEYGQAYKIMDEVRNQTHEELLRRGIVL